METLSTSVSTPFKPYTTASTSSAALPLLPTSLKPPSSSAHIHPHTHLPTRRNSFSNQPHQHQPLILVNNQIPHKPSTTTKAASGYAAALLDISLCQNSIQLVSKDANRFANVIRTKPVLELMRNPFIDVKEKNQALKELIDNGKFEKHFAALLKMLIEKNKFGMIGKVLDAFRSMYCELCVGT